MRIPCALIDSNELSASQSVFPQPPTHGSDGGGGVGARSFGQVRRTATASAEATQERRVEQQKAAVLGICKHACLNELDDEDEAFRGTGDRDL